MVSDEYLDKHYPKRECCDTRRNTWHTRQCEARRRDLGTERPWDNHHAEDGSVCMEHHAEDGKCIGHSSEDKCEREAGENEYWMARGVRVVETNSIPPGPIIVSEFTWGEQGAVQEFTHPGTEIVRELAGCAGAHHTSDGICVGHSPGELVGCAMESIGMDDEGHVLLGTMNPGDKVGIDLSLPSRWCCGGLPTDRHTDGCPTNFFAEGQTVVQADQHWLFGPGRERLLCIAEDRVSSDRTFENETRLH